MEVYRSNAGGIMRVARLANGRILVKEGKEGKDARSFENMKQFSVHLYNKGYHLVMTDRATLFGRLYEEAKNISTFIDMIPNNELAFINNGIVYTGWFFAFKPDSMVELRCNTDFSYTNELGYKAVTVKIDELIIIHGDIR